MQLESLKVFCDVVRWASFSRGASASGVSQSSASQTVHQIEERLGVKLIDRSKRPFVLTPPGKLFYEACRELVGRYLEVEDRVKAFGNDTSGHDVVGTVRVASIYSVGLNHMSAFARRFAESFPRADARVEYLHPTRVVEAVLNETVDLGLISYPRRWPDLDVIPWREEEMVLAFHPSHRFAQVAGGVAAADLDGEAFVGFDSDLPIRRAVDRFLRQQGVHVQVALQFDNIENVKRALEISIGVAILPVPTLARELEAGTLRACRLRDLSLTRPLAIIHRRGRDLGATASRFLGMLTEAEGGTAPAATSATATAKVAATT